MKSSGSRVDRGDRVPSTQWYRWPMTQNTCSNCASYHQSPSIRQIFKKKEIKTKSSAHHSSTSHYTHSWLVYFYVRTSSFAGVVYNSSSECNAIGEFHRPNAIVLRFFLSFPASSFAMQMCGGKWICAAANWKWNCCVMLGVKLTLNAAIFNTLNMNK